VCYRATFRNLFWVEPHSPNDRGTVIDLDRATN